MRTVEEEYGAGHPIYKVSYGEIHLMNTCVICRNKRRLILIPVMEVVRLEEYVRLVGVKRVPLLRFTMDEGKPLEVDFSARHCKDGEEVVSWFIEHIGADKVDRSQNVLMR